MKKKVTIKDIAERVGVSTGTVDRVLHNRGNVAPEVRAKIQQAITDLGYERNILASALAYNRSVRLVVFLPELRDDSYWNQVRDGLEKALKSVQHYGMTADIFYFDYFNPPDFKQKAQDALSTKPDGILLPPIFLEEAQWFLEEAIMLEIPTAIINTKVQSDHPICYIGQDSYQAGVLGARLLDFGLSQGEVACILNLDIGTSSARHLLDKEQGFRDYFLNNNEKTIEIIRRDFDRFNDTSALKTFLSQLFSEYPKLGGIFVTNSRANKVVACLEELKLSSKLVGFDLTAPNLDFLNQNKINFLINQNPYDQGYQGVMSLFKHLILKESVDPLQYLPLDIVVKENAAYYLKEIEKMELIS